MTPERRAAASMFRRTPSSPDVGAASPGCQFDVTRTAVKPASRSWDILTFVLTRSGARTASSATPSVIVGPPAYAGSGERETGADRGENDDEGAPQEWGYASSRA